MTLEGKKIAVLIAPRGTEEAEFTKPKEAVEARRGRDSRRHRGRRG